MLARLAALFVLCALFAPLPAHAQRGGGSTWDIPDHKIEITGIYGYRWTWSRSFATVGGVGNVDVADSGFWGVSLGVVARPLMTIELLYNRQDSEITFQPGGFGSKTDLAKIHLDYWQIGATQEVPRGKIAGFGSLSLGGTRIAEKGTSIDTWQFSMIFGAGVKAYLNQRVGLRAQARLPFTFVTTSLGLGCGTGGCGSYVGGTGIAAFDLSGGLFLMLGD